MKHLPALTLLACSLALSSCLTTTPDGKTVTMNMPPKGAVMDPVHGKETAFAIGALKGINGHTANGVGIAHGFADKSFLVTLELNITPAAAGSSYEGFLETATGAKLIALGTLETATGNAQHKLAFQTSQDISFKNLKVRIILRKKGDLAGVGEAVSEGVLKPYSR